MTDHRTETVGALGSGVSWVLAITNWTLADVQQIVAISAGAAAFAVSIATLWFMFRRGGKRQ